MNKARKIAVANENLRLTMKVLAERAALRTEVLQTRAMLNDDLHPPPEAYRSEPGKRARNRQGLSPAQRLLEKQRRWNQATQTVLRTSKKS